jgi:hypothetical protein
MWTFIEGRPTVRKQIYKLKSRIGHEPARKTPWRARFTFNEKLVHLGFFVTKVDAVYAINYAYEHLAEERAWAGKWRSFADFKPENPDEPISRVREQVRQQIRRLLRKAVTC